MSVRKSAQEGSPAARSPGARVSPAHIAAARRSEESPRTTTARRAEELLFAAATEVAQMLSEREVSSRELTDLLLTWIDATNPSLNAIVELDPERALQDADGADRQIASGVRKPLLGVPVTIKEAFDVAGMHTTWGNPAFADYVASSDATVVRRLRAAGAIIAGKSNVQLMLADHQTSNELYGTTLNPWDATLTPGGSSGGSCAAVAAGMSFLEFGSDLVGSIRIPASFCGVFGLRPSVGVVPLTGLQVPHAPTGPSEMTYMAAAGPIARSASDLRAGLNATGGPEAPGSRAYSWALSAARHRRLADYRVGVVLDHERAPVSSDVAGVLSDLVDAIARAGVEVIEGWPEGVDPALSHESFGYQVQLFLAFAQGGSEFARASEFIDQEKRRMAARSAWGRYFDELDVFLCPANFTPAFAHDTRPLAERTIVTADGVEHPYEAQSFWTSHASLPGLPAAVAPVGRTAAGLPVGAQIVGPLYEDDTAITFAELLADHGGGYERPPRR
jgi:amidase